MIDRTIDQWETQHSASTIKNTIAPLVRVLDEAVRDDLLPATLPATGSDGPSGNQLST